LGTLTLEISKLEKEIKDYLNQLAIKDTRIKTLEDYFKS